MNVEVFFLFQMVEISSNIDILVSEGKFCRTGQLVSGLISKHCVYFSMVVGYLWKAVLLQSRAEENKTNYELHLTSISCGHIMSYQYLLAPCKKTFVSKPSFASLQGSCWRNSCQLIPLQRKTNRFPATCHKNLESSCLRSQKASEKRSSILPKSIFSQSYKKEQDRHFKKKTSPMCPFNQTKMFKKRPEGIVPNHFPVMIGSFSQSHLCPSCAARWHGVVPGFHRTIGATNHQDLGECPQQFGPSVPFVGNEETKRPSEMSRKWGKHLMVLFDFPPKFKGWNKSWNFLVVLLETCP